jgi:hypothetical protein
MTEKKMCKIIPTVKNALITPYSQANSVRPDSLFNIFTTPYIFGYFPLLFC